MNTETLSALKQVNLQIQQLQGVLQDSTLTPPLTPQEASLVGQSINDLEELQDTLIHQTLQAMVDQLNATNGQLQALLTTMQATSARLGKLAAGIRQVSDAVGALAQITAKAMSAGLIG
jgi:methyl-accepting chemotaxis protein